MRLVPLFVRPKWRSGGLIPGTHIHGRLEEIKDRYFTSSRSLSLYSLQEEKMLDFFSPFLLLLPFYVCRCCCVVLSFCSVPSPHDSVYPSLFPFRSGDSAEPCLPFPLVFSCCWRLRLRRSRKETELSIPNWTWSAHTHTQRQAGRPGRQ